MKSKFATAETIEKFLETPEGENFAEKNFAYLFFDEDNQHEIDRILSGEMFKVPYWIENYQGEEFFVDYVEGYHDKYPPGDITTTTIFSGEKPKTFGYIDSIPLPEEIEHQAENGEFFYEYRGHSFLRIWKELKNE